MNFLLAGVSLIVGSMALFNENITHDTRQLVFTLHICTAYILIVMGGNRPKGA